MESPLMPHVTFLLTIFALVATTLAARIAVSRERFDDLPPIPRGQ